MMAFTKQQKEIKQMSEQLIKMDDEIRMRYKAGLPVNCLLNKAETLKIELQKKLIEFKPVLDLIIYCESLIEVPE